MLARLHLPGKGAGPGKVETAAALVSLLALAFPDRVIHVVADAAYHGPAPRALPENLTWTCRIPRNAVLYDLAPPRTGRGRPRTKGTRLGTAECWTAPVESVGRRSRDSRQELAEGGDAASVKRSHPGEQAAGAGVSAVPGGGWRAADPACSAPGYRLAALATAWLTEPEGFSLPSRHTELAGLVAGACVRAVGVRGAPRRAIPLLTAAGGGASRVYQDVHWPSNLVAGMAVRR